MRKKKLKSTHRRGVENIVERLESLGYTDILVEEEFYMNKICQRTGRPVAGEADVIASKTLSTGKTYLLCFEYKSNNKQSRHRDKAILQLCKDNIQYRKIRKPDAIRSFYVHDNMVYERIRKVDLERVVWDYRF